MNLKLRNQSIFTVFFHFVFDASITRFECLTFGLNPVGASVGLCDNGTTGWQSSFPTTPVYPSWDDNYGLGVSHHEHIKADGKEATPPISTGPTSLSRGGAHVSPFPSGGGQDQERTLIPHVPLGAIHAHAARRGGRGASS